MQKPQVDDVIATSSIRVEWFRRDPAGGTLFVRPAAEAGTIVSTSTRVEWFQRDPGGGTLFVRPETTSS